MTLEQIRAALAIETHELNAIDHERVWRYVQNLSSRITCESWGHKMVWKIPPYGTPEWQELHAAWLESKDEEDHLTTFEKLAS